MDIFFIIGGGVCHQYAARTIEVGGRLLPLCARCTGIYIGFFVAAGYFFAAKRLAGDKILVGWQIPLAALSFLPFMLDGAGSYLGLWESNNWIRILTGLPAGVSLPYFFILLKNIHLHTIGQTPIYKSLREQLALLGVGYLLVIVIYGGGFGAYYPIALMAAGGVLGFMLTVVGAALRSLGGRKIQGSRFVICQWILIALWIGGGQWLRIALFG